MCIRDRQNTEANEDSLRDVVRRLKDELTQLMEEIHGSLKRDMEVFFEESAIYLYSGKVKFSLDYGILQMT